MSEDSSRLRIADPVAVGKRRYTGPDGAEILGLVAVGKPAPEVTGSQEPWYTEVFIEGVTKGVVRILGVGPFDSLQNACTFVFNFVRPWEVNLE